MEVLTFPESVTPSEIPKVPLCTSTIGAVTAVVPSPVPSTVMEPVPIVFPTLSFTVPPAIWKVPPDTEKRLPAKPAARLILISSAVATSIIFLLAGTSIVSPSSISLLILMYVGSLASAVLSGTAANASFRVA